MSQPHLKGDCAEGALRSGVQHLTGRVAVLAIVLSLYLANGGNVNVSATGGQAATAAAP